MDIKNYFSENKVTSSIISVLLLLVLIMGGFYLYYSRPQNETQETNNTNQAAAEVDKTCGELVADDNKTEGPSPLQVTLKAKLNGEVDQNKPVCQWKIDGAELYNSYPKDNTCVFGRDPIVSVGEHVVSYTVEGKSCEASKKIIVK